jgi:hypothetical protein
LATGQEILTEQAAERRAPGKVRTWYRVAAYGVFNTILFLILLNLVLYLISLTRRPPAEPDPLSRYGGDALQKAYPGWRAEDVRTLVNETAHRRPSWEPFTGFRERTFRGKYVNVDAAGFRVSKDQAPWPPDPQRMNVFVFGGSTTFGYGLPDDETIVSYLGECTPANSVRGRLAVYNFGREGYLSTQELILFQQLIKAGFVPQAAVFIDGINDFFLSDGQPSFAEGFRRFMDGQLGAPANPLDQLMMIKAFHRLRDWLKPQAKPQPQKQAWNNADPAVLDGVVKRWLINKKMIEVTADAFGVRPVFVWQPVPGYKYDLHYHFLSTGSAPMGGYPPTLAGYGLVDNLQAQGKLGVNVLWLGDMQQDKHENLYVDAVHYNASFSREIAGRICEFMNQRLDGK